MSTLGTSSSHPDVIAELYDAGTDIFRLDLSHGSRAAHGERCRAIRAVDTGTSRPAVILADLQGTAFRLGSMVGGFVSLCAGQMLCLELDESPGNSRRIPLPHPEFFRLVRPGDEILIDDGRVRLLVMSAALDHVETIVLAGGYIADAKRVSVPTRTWPAALTEKDRADAVSAAGLGVDWLALSAACGAEGFAEVRSLVGTRPGLMARIDNPAALSRIEEVLGMADGVMFGRHDLSMHMSSDQLIRLQEMLFMKCSASGKILVAAIQQLVEPGHGVNQHNADPKTESEAAMAVLRIGAHVLLLSAGSASGAFPVEHVVTLERLIRNAERSIRRENNPKYDRMQEISQIDGAMPPRLNKGTQGDGDRLPVIEMQRRSGDLCMPDASHMAEP